MLTISTRMMAAIDLANTAIEVAIKAKGVNPNFAIEMVFRVNIVVGRFVTAAGKDLTNHIGVAPLRF